MKHLMRSVVEGLKVSQVHWEKNTGKLAFEYDADLAEDAESGDPLLVQRIKRAEAEVKAAMEAATAAGLSVNWVNIGPNGNRQLIADPTLIITRTY